MPGFYCYGVAESEPAHPAAVLVLHGSQQQLEDVLCREVEGAFEVLQLDVSGAEAMGRLTRC